MKKITAWPILAFALAAPTMMDCKAAEDAAKEAQQAASGCDELSAGLSAIGNLEIDGKFKATLDTVYNLQVLADGMLADTLTSCTNIAKDLGASDSDIGNLGAPTDPKHPDPGYVQSMCQLATAKIDAILQANAGCTLTASLGEVRCSASVQATADCAAQCSVDGKCDASANVQCSGGLYGKCEPVKCQGSVTCEGSVDAAVNCSGTCQAECQGTCSGACSGTVTGGCEGVCEGKCDGQASNGQAEGACKGTCEGTCSKPAASATCKGSCKATCSGKCTGSCAVEAQANFDCGGSVSCSGGCTGGYTEPKCSGEATINCNVDADCKANCSANAKATAECTPPTVTVTASCQADDVAKLIATLQTNLPALFLNVKARGTAFVDTIGQLEGNVQAMVSGGTDIGGKALACLKASVDAFVSIKANVNVSVQASASVSGKASAG